METQDHKKPTLSGLEGHGSVHVCHKCGWPFPKPHPSAKHRRAHKRVCGTIEGYKLDNSQDKPQLNGGSDGEHVSDDELKTPSGKVAEMTISRRSSSGVGSRSSRSTRSDDDVFTDAVTEFGDSPAVSRENSLQVVTDIEPDSSKLGVENAIAENLSASNIPPDGKQLQAIQTLEGENDKVEAPLLSEDPISSSTYKPALGNVSLTNDDDNAVGQNTIQSFRLTELDIGTDEGKGIGLNRDFSELTTPCNETAEKASEDVSDLRSVSEESLDSVPAGEMVKPMEEKVERSHDVDYLGKHSAQNVEVIDGKPSKSSDVVEEGELKIEAKEHFDVLAVPDALAIQDNPDIPFENLDHKGGKINIPVASDAALAEESLEFTQAQVIDESSSDTDLAKSGESNLLYDVRKNVQPTEDMLKQTVLESKFIDEQDSAEELDQTSDVKASSADINQLSDEEALEDMKNNGLKDIKVGSTEEKISTSASENDLLEGATTVDNGDNQERSANPSVHASDCVKAEGGHFVMDETSSAFPELSPSESAPEVKDLTHDNNNISYDEKVEVDGTILDGMENKPLSAETAAGSDDNNDELFELKRNSDQGNMDKLLDSGSVMMGQPQQESIITSGDVQEMQSADDNKGGGECINTDEECAVVDTDTLFGSTSKMSEDDVSSFPSSAADNGLGVTEGRITEEPAVSAVDVVDSGSQTDSLEGNWGSVSVLSTTSDALPVTETAPSNNYSQASAEAATVNLEPRHAEGQDYESKTPVEPHTVLHQIEGTSEIQPSNIYQQTSALPNEPLGGKRTDEITAKITNWSTEKQHTPLKTLLGEASAKSREESPNHQLSEIPVTIDGFSGSETAKDEVGKEWNSPARYPVNIKTEKKRGKSRPYWVPFLCCSSSSVNAR